MALTVISVIYIHLNLARWKTLDVIDHDILHYYSYLPAAFYERDISLSFLNDSANHVAESRYYHPNKLLNGNYVIKTTMGMALAYLPFFGLAHIYATSAGEATNGFSAPYHFAVLCSSLLYFLLGLVFLYRVLRRYFPESPTLFSLFCLCFGTNVFFYLTIGAGMPHAIDFALVSLFLYYVIRWHDQPGTQRAVMLGFIGGWLVLLRPVNVLVFLFFFLYDVSSFKSLAIKVQTLLKNKMSILLVILCAILVCVPQLLYWKKLSGHYFFNSYMGEHFFFNKPHVFDGLFSFRKGWLLYTPLMAFSLAGFFYLGQKLRAYALVIPFFTVVYIYVVFSWWCWWYGGSFGQRVLIDIYPFLAIPLTAFIVKIGDFSRLKRVTLYSVFVIFILLNLFQTLQAKYNIIHYDSMTRENYFRVFFTTSKKADREKYLKHPDYEKALRGEDEY